MLRSPAAHLLCPSSKDCHQPPAIPLRIMDYAMGMRGICELNLKSLNGQSLSLYCAGDAGLGDHSPNPFIDQLITASTPKASASPRPKQVPPIESASPDLAAAPSPRLLPRGQMASDPPCAGSPQSTQVSTLRSRINNARFGQISDKLPATSAAVAVANILGFNSQTPKGLNAASPRAATAAAAASAKYEVKAKSEEELLRLKEVPEVRANPLRRSLTTGVLETGRKDGKDAKEAPEAPQARQEAVVQEADLREMTTELEELAEAEVQNHDAIRQKVLQKQTETMAQQQELLAQLQKEHSRFWTCASERWSKDAEALSRRGMEMHRTHTEELCKALQKAGLTLTVDTIFSAAQDGVGSPRPDGKEYAVGDAVSSEGSGSKQSSAVSEESPRGMGSNPQLLEPERAVKRDDEAKRESPDSQSSGDERQPGKSQFGTRQQLRIETTRTRTPFAEATDGQRGEGAAEDSNLARHGSSFLGTAVTSPMSSPGPSPGAQRLKFLSAGVRVSMRQRSSQYTGDEAKSPKATDLRQEQGSPRNATPKNLDRRQTSRCGSFVAEKINFKKGAQIGSGGFGVVYIGLNDDTGELLAIKNIPFDAGDAQIKQKLRELQKEIAVMKSLSHPNIVRYFQTAKESANGQSSINIFMEYVPGGSIASLLKQFGPLKEKVCKSYGSQILQGLVYLHEKNVVHRDIKGANILLGVDGACKLTDFGAAGLLDDLAPNLRSLKGTPYWMAPEVITQSGHGWQADIWSLGCTVMEMLTAAPPFQHVSRSYMSLVHFIVDEKWEITVAPGLSQPVSEFMLAMLKRDPNQRGTALSFLRHPYLRDDANKLEPPISPLYALVRSLTAHDQERHRSDPEPASPKSQSPRPAPADHRGSVCDPQEEMARAAAQEAEREKEIAQQREQRDKEGKQAIKAIDNFRAARTQKSSKPRGDSPPPSDADTGSPVQPTGSVGSLKLTYLAAGKSGRREGKSRSPSHRSLQNGYTSPGRSRSAICDGSDSPSVELERVDTAPCA